MSRSIDKLFIFQYIPTFDKGQKEQMKHTGKIGLIIILAVAIAAGFFLLRRGEPVVWEEVLPAETQKHHLKKLNRVLYLNSFFKHYQSLSPNQEQPVKKFKAGISSLEVLEGERRNDGDSLLITGRSVALKVWIPGGIISGHGLEFLEIELNSSRGATLDVLEQRPDKKSPQPLLHTFKLLAGRTGKEDDLRTLTVQLPRRFQGEAVTLRVNSVSGRNLRLRLGGVLLLTRSYKAVENMPQLGIFQYGTNNLRQMKSVFMRAGSTLTYTIHTGPPKGKDGRVIMDGYLGSAEGKLVVFDLWVNGKKKLSQRVTHRPAYFRFKVAPRKGLIQWRIVLKGAPDRVGALGNVAFYRSFDRAVRKHVIYYLVDSLRADKGGVKRPLMETRFKDGAVFTSAYANATRTADSLPVTFTGKYKFILVEKDELTPYVPESELLLAEYFKRKGYVTAAFINNPWLEQSNCVQGFDFVDKCWLPVEKASAYPTEEEYKNLKYGHMELNIRDVVRRNKDKPLFLFIHTMEPHVPYEPPPGKRIYSKGADKKILDHLFSTVTRSPDYPTLENPGKTQLQVLKSLYKDQVLLANESFGRIHDELERSGVINKHSLTILTSDHGERFYEHRSWIHGPPDVYNEVLRIPLMIKGSGIQSGRFAFNVQLADIFPTIMHWLGDPPSGNMVGKSLLLQPEAANRRVIYSDGTGKEPQYSFIKGDLKVIIDAAGAGIYNLNMDPGETVNLASQGQYKSLLEEAKRFRRQFKRLKIAPSKKRRSLTTAEKKRLKTLGYIN